MEFVMVQCMEDYINSAGQIFARTRYEASDEDVRKLADNMVLLEKRGLGKLNKRLIDSKTKVWDTIAEHNFAVLLASRLCSSITINYEPEGLKQPIDFKIDQEGVTYWLQMKRSAIPERENRQDNLIRKIETAARQTKVGKFFSCELSDNLKEDCLTELITFIKDKAVSASDEESFLFTGKKNEKAEIKIWSPGGTALSELTLGYNGDLDVVEITGQASQQIRESLFNAAGAFTWDADERNINLIVMEADNKHDIQICEAIFGTECFNFIGDKHSWCRKNDGFFTDSGISQKVIGVIATKRKRERDEEISALSPEEVVSRLSPKAKKVSDNMTPEEIKKALEWKSPGPIADYSLILYMNDRFKHLLETTRRLLSFDKIIYYNMRPPMGKSNFN
jgi:hypothetical protein